ncbi:MAG: glycosyltransferase [Pseudomonadota bacterium]
MTRSAQNPWDFFDRLFCISLEERTDRRMRATAEFQRLGILDRVEFVLVKKHPEDACQGIFESHILCMDRALAGQAKNVVIFEDDVIFHRYSPVTLDLCAEYLSANPDWTMLFFGCLIRGCSTAGRPGIKTIRYHALTHAYAVNREFAEVIRKQPWTGVPYDVVLRNLGPAYLGATPFFAFQSNAATDNDACRDLDRVRRLFGGLRTIQTMNECFHSHRAAIIIGHLAALGLLGMWLW